VWGGAPALPLRAPLVNLLRSGAERARARRGGTTPMLHCRSATKVDATATNSNHCLDPSRVCGFPKRGASLPTHRPRGGPDDAPRHEFERHCQGAFLRPQDHPACGCAQWASSVPSARQQVAEGSRCQVACEAELVGGAATGGRWVRVTGRDRLWSARGAEPLRLVEERPLVPRLARQDLAKHHPVGGALRRTDQAPSDAMSGSSSSQATGKRGT